MTRRDREKPAMRHPSGRRRSPKLMPQSETGVPEVHRRRVLRRPVGLDEQVAKWEARYGSQLKVKASVREPIAAWPRGKNTNAIEAVENLRAAIRTANAPTTDPRP
jgi:hypothetical protein